MTTDRAKAALQKTKSPEKQEESGIKSVSQFVTAYEGKIRRLLPASTGLTPERLGELAVTEMKRTPKLLQADVVSLMGALVQAGKMGLEPGINAYLIPFWNSKRGCLEVQMIPDYRGILKLARNSGEIGPFSAHPVYRKDVFDYQYGSEEFLRHRPVATDEERSVDDIKFFYAIARYKIGGFAQFEVMTKGEVDKVRARSKSGDDGPWVTDYIQMGQKTVSKRLCKYLPTSVDVQQLVRMDDLADAGKSQQNDAVITGDYTRVEDDEALGELTDRPEEPQKAAPDAPLTEEEQKAALEREQREAAGK